MLNSYWENVFYCRWRFVKHKQRKRFERVVDIWIIQTSLEESWKVKVMFERPGYEELWHKLKSCGWNGRCSPCHSMFSLHFLRSNEKLTRTSIWLELINWTDHFNTAWHWWTCTQLLWDTFTIPLEGLISISCLKCYMNDISMEKHRVFWRDSCRWEKVIVLCHWCVLIFRPGDQIDTKYYHPDRFR
jgi:hypothetical protein